MENGIWAMYTAVFPMIAVLTNGMVSPRTTDEVMYQTSFRYDPDVVELAQIMEGKAGATAEDVSPYDESARRMIDSELTKRGKSLFGDNGK